MPSAAARTPDPTPTTASGPGVAAASGTSAPESDLFQSAAPDFADPDLAAPETPPDAGTPDEPGTDAPLLADDPAVVEAPADDTPAEDAPAGGAPAPVVEFDIAIPLPGEFAPPQADGRPAPSTRTGLLDVAFPSQEARDAVAFHVKRSAEYDQLTAAVEAGIEARAALAHLESAPEQAMFQLEQLKPDLARAYVENWMQRNPVAAALTVRDKLGYLVSESDNADRLTDRAALAQHAAADALREGQTQYQATLARQRFVTAGQQTIRAVSQGAGIDLQSRAGQFVAQQLATAFEQHFTQHPQASRTELAGLPVVQDILNDYQRLVGAPVATHATVAAPVKGAARFTQQAQAAQAARRLAPGQTRIPALRAEKFKRGTTLDDLP